MLQINTIMSRPCLIQKFYQSMAIGVFTDFTANLANFTLINKLYHTVYFENIYINVSSHLLTLNNF